MRIRAAIAAPAEFRSAHRLVATGAIVVISSRRLENVRFGRAPADAVVAEAINSALHMPAERMSLMRQRIRENNVYRWAGRMLH